MSDALRDLFVEVTGEEETTQTQVEEHSRDPVDEEVERIEALAAQAEDDALDDAVAGAEVDGGSHD